MHHMATLMTRAQRILSDIERIDGHAPSRHVAKHIKMASTPFTFFRGCAQLFYSDLASHTIQVPPACFTVPLTSVMGDCHTSNFGFLTEEGSHGDTVIFAPNDFDDACVGYAHWDIIRFLTSLSLVKAHCDDVVNKASSGNEKKPVINNNHVQSAQHAFLARYSETCSRVTNDATVINEAMERSPDGKLQKMYNKAVRRAAMGEEFTTKSALAKAVFMDEDGLSFKHIANKLTPLSDIDYALIADTFSPFMDDALVDIVQRENSGTGSVNMQRFYCLVGPAKPHSANSFSHCHIVEIKQQREAAPLYHFKYLCPVNRLNPAHLTARSQRRMQRRPDLLLDEVYWNDAHWLIRSRHHAKVGISPEDIGMGNKAISEGFTEFAELCGYTLALAHCRGDRRSVRFASEAACVFQACTPALIKAANRYADQTIEDHALFKQYLQKS